MRCGIPLLGDRVAARCTCANSILVITVSGGRVISSGKHSVEIGNRIDLLAALLGNSIDTLVCGGIDRQTREELRSAAVTVIDNVACSADQALTALDDGCLCPGFGFSDRPAGPEISRDRSGCVVQAAVNCLNCTDRVCLRGENCMSGLKPDAATDTAQLFRIMEAATDVSTETERRLCRLAELVYFCLEMGYRRLGIAYCTELEKPTRILARVLSRSFEIFPVCCRIGGRLENPDNFPAHESETPSVVPPISCNPVAQAAVLARCNTDLNIMVGLCLGADSIFSRESAAPVTTLFVRDRSLANNPIGALYSDYYLRENVGQPFRPETFFPVSA